MKDARRAEIWPNQYLEPIVADGLEDGVKFEKLTFNQFIGGYVTKVFSEVDKSRNGSPEHNQLFMLIQIIRLNEKYTWEDVRPVVAGLFSGLDRGSFTWEDRAPMETWWKLAVDSLRDRVITRATNHMAVKRPAPGPHPHPGQAHQGQPPAKAIKLKGKDVFGIEASLLKNASICIKWNTGSCQIQTSPHDSPDKSETKQVRHVCGGCWATSGVEDSSHPAKTCTKRGKDGLFH